ncbi:hypothetical protein DEO72_LG6g936 [Vigna unguiculata]|uniref:Uncharacterized protein n=1 Tax=Vigna unguiculata TaxID=3917 RepID=A0A4D6M8U0_VIGUN|nr:hypothetical protein DEO72_LG6g936 [Vigna unguiculata]
MIKHHTALAQLLAQAEGSRSGERLSPRRETLAQASPFRLGEGSKRGTVNLRRISLRRDPSRLSEAHDRSKQRRSPERLSA